MSAPRITAAARVQRLLAMLQWAASHPDGVPVQELCDRFRLKHADLARELDLASMIGADSPNYDEMPFEVFLEDGLVFVRLFSFRRPMRLSPAEGLALVAAADVLVDREGATDPQTPLARGLAKLAASLGIEPGDSIDVDLDPDGGESGAILRQAIALDRQVSFTYWSYGRDQIARRVVEPWGLFSDRGSWYLAGWAVDPGAERNFRLDRMQDAVIEDAARTQPVPSGADHNVDIGDEGAHVVLDLGPGARWVAEAHPIVSAEPIGEDRLRVTMAIAGPSWLERLLVRLGPEATVVAIDPSLGDRALGERAAERILARYQGAVGTDGAAR